MVHTTRFTHPIRRPHNECGAVLVISLLTLTLLSLLGGAAITTSNIEQMISANYKTSSKAKTIAAAGIEHGRVILKTTKLDDALYGAAEGTNSGKVNFDFSPGTCTITSGLSNNSCNLGVANNAYYTVTVKNNWSDSGEDADDDTDNIVIIESTGTDSTGASATIEATVMKDTNFMPDFTGALSLVGDAENQTACSLDANCRFDGRDWTAADADAYDRVQGAWQTAYDAAAASCLAGFAGQFCRNGAVVTANAAAATWTGDGEAADANWDKTTAELGGAAATKYGIGVSNLTAQAQTDSSSDLDTRVNQVKLALCGSFGATANCNNANANFSQGLDGDAYTSAFDFTNDASVGSGNALENSEIQSFVDIAKGVANTTFDAATLAGQSDTLTAAEITAMQTEDITYFDLDSAGQDLTFDTSTKVSGSGLLIIEGTEDNMVNFNGGLEWDGVVIVVGDNVGLNFGTHANGTADITGGVIVAEQKLGESSVGNLEFTWQSGGRMMYSSEQIGLVQNAVMNQGGGRVKTILYQACEGSC